MKRTLAGVSVGWLGLSMIGDGVPALLLPHQLLAAGIEDATTLGLVALAALALAALVQPVAGHLADILGRFPVIAGGTALALAGLFGMLWPSLALPGALLALMGGSVAQAGQQPLLPDLVPARMRGRGAGLKGAFDVAGAFIAFVLLAALLGSGNETLAVAALAVVLVASFGAAYALLPRTPRTPRTLRVPGRRRPLLDLRMGRPFAQLIIARFLFLLGIYVVGRFLVLYVARRFGLDADQAAEQGGALLAALTLVTVLASPPAGWLADRIGRGRLMLAGGAIGGLGIALLPLGGSVVALVGIGALIALGSAAFSAGSWALLADFAHGANAGRLMGLAHWGTAGAAAAAGLAGILIDAGERIVPGTGFGVTFVLAGILAAAGGAAAWRSPAAHGGSGTGPAMHGD